MATANDNSAANANANAEAMNTATKVQMQELMQKMDSADAHIQTNNENTIVNASKDRLRAKKRTEEMQQMQEDYEKNVRADPEEMDKTVKHEVEVALLRMTEKRMKMEMQLEQAMKTIEEKDQRIAQLELIVHQLSAQRAQSQVVNETMAPDGTIVMGIPPQDDQFYDQTAITAMPPRVQADTDKDLNEREEFSHEEQMMRQDGSFGLNHHQQHMMTGQSQQMGQHLQRHHSSQEHQQQLQEEMDEEDDFWYGQGSGQQDQSGLIR